MRHGANGSFVTRRALAGSIIAVVACAGLMAACSSSAPRTARHAGTTGRTTASTTTTTASTTTNTTTTTTPSVGYRVKHGDRLSTIATRFHVSIPAIVYVNHISNPDRLSDGQVLKIPTHPPLVLVVTPSKGPPGQRFEFDLIGSKPTEVVRFTIDSPAGKHTGPAHIASKDGTVTTTYQTSPTDRSGTYKVGATGNKGSRTRASFLVVKRP